MKQLTYITVTMKILLILSIAFTIANSATVFNYNAIDSKLANYDSRVRPYAGEKPVEVEASLYITRAYDWNEANKDMNVDMYFRQEWTDPRLTFTSASPQDVFKAGHKLAEKIWLPDTFFSLGHKDKLNAVTVPNVFVRINPEGRVFISSRYTSNVPCKKDDQGDFKCKLSIESYGFDITDLDFKWKDVRKSDQTKVEWVPEGMEVSVNSTSDLVELSSGKYRVLFVDLTVRKA